MTPAARRKPPVQDIVAKVRSDDFVNQVALALPPNIRPERFVRAVVTAIYQNPDVTQDPESLFQAAIMAAQDGLVPDGREAAFVVLKEQGRPRVAYWPMIGGYRHIAAKHGITLVADVVRDGDAFKWARVPPMLEHRPKLGHGEIVCAYAAGYRAGAEWSFAAAPVVMDMDEIARVRRVSRAADSPSGPWRQWFDRMCIKTVARRCFHELPLGDLDEVDANILRAADDEADLNANEREAVDAIARVTPPALPGPDDSGSATASPADADTLAGAASVADPDQPQEAFKIPDTVRQHLDPEAAEVAQGEDAERLNRLALGDQPGP